MDDLRFYALVNSISVISRRRMADNERLGAMESRLRLNGLPRPDKVSDIISLTTN